MSEPIVLVFSLISERNPFPVLAITARRPSLRKRGSTHRNPATNLFADVSRFQSEPLTLIEEDFPVADISELSKLESYRKEVYRPTYYIHKWWARRTGAVFRAILLGALLPPGSELMKRYYEPVELQDKIVLDPFMGGGTPVGEAIRLGLHVVGCDINPVAWFLVKKALEPVDVFALDIGFHEVERDAHREIQSLYSTNCRVCGSLSDVVYAYWSMEIECANCSNLLALRPSQVVAPHASKPWRGLVTCPECEALYLSESLEEKLLACPECGAQYDASQRTASNVSYHCPCGHKETILSAVQRTQESPNYKLLGYYYDCPEDGKQYKKPDSSDMGHLETIHSHYHDVEDKLLLPRQEIPAGYNTDQMRRYNYRFWYQMFNERQRLSLAPLLSAILELEDRNVRENLLVLFSGALEFNSMFCSPKGLGTGAVRHTFAHHAFIPPKVVLEANVWGVGRSSGGFASLYKRRLRRGKLFARHPVERKVSSGTVTKVSIPGDKIEGLFAGSFAELNGRRDRNLLLLCQSSESLPLPEKSVDAVVTDPPFFDNVMYSELSDFFYVWLRLGLKHSHEEFRTELVPREKEIIQNERQQKDSEFYTEGMTAVFAESHRVLKDEGLLTFTFHHGKSEAWDSIARALAHGGFRVVTFYPVHAEMDVAVPIYGKRSTKFDIIFVCRKREGRKDSQVALKDDVVHDAVRPEIERLTSLFNGRVAFSEGDIFSFYHACLVQLYTSGYLQKLPSEFEQLIRSWLAAEDSYAIS